MARARRWHSANAAAVWGAAAPSYAEVQRHANCTKIGQPLCRARPSPPRPRHNNNNNQSLWPLLAGLAGGQKPAAPEGGGGSPRGPGAAGNRQVRAARGGAWAGRSHPRPATRQPPDRQLPRRPEEREGDKTCTGPQPPHTARLPSPSPHTQAPPPPCACLNCRTLARRPA